MNTLPTESDVLIVGGGPVGLLLARLLGGRGLRCVVLERRLAPPAQSMAIGVTPPSLEIMRPFGLDRQLVAAGVPVRHARVFEDRDELGHLSFDGIDSDYPFFLSLPQSRTVEFLRDSLQRTPRAHLLGGLEFVNYGEHAAGVSVQVRRVHDGKEGVFRARYLVGCDGHRSGVRAAAGIPCSLHRYRQRWIMADFADDSGLGDEARLYFNAEGSVESFPLPGDQRRWIVQVSSRQQHVYDPAALLRKLVRERAGFELGEPLGPPSQFGAKRQLARRFRQGRVLLCGDAAHVMSSIGGQGMNTGFAAAELLAESLQHALRHPAEADSWFAAYDRVRRRAFNVAADRAARGMALGTARGWLSSRLRRRIIRDLLFGPLRRKLAPHFTMLTIPDRNLAHTRLPTRLHRQWQPA